MRKVTFSKGPPGIEGGDLHALGELAGGFFEGAEGGVGDFGPGVALELFPGGDDTRGLVDPVAVAAGELGRVGDEHAFGGEGEIRAEAAVVVAEVAPELEAPGDAVFEAVGGGRALDGDHDFAVVEELAEGDAVGLAVAADGFEEAVEVGLRFHGR